VEWFRWYHGAVSDDKWPLVARKSGQPIAVVVAVWAALLECASQSGDRGSIADFDPESMDALLQLEDGATQAVLDALSEGKKPRIVDGCIANWSKRQPKREDGSAERAREWRERKKAEANAQRTQGERTPNANEHRTEQRREEQRREETPPLPPSQGEVCVSAEADVSASSPADHLHTSPAIAFEELRQRYSELGRAEGPRSGLTEFISLFGRNHGPAALEPVFAGVEAWAKSGQWQRGFAPGLARFLRERLWESPPPVEREKAEALPQIADVRYYAKTYGVQGLERYCSDHKLNPEPYRAACAPELLLHSEVRQEVAVC
jgi:hypothetical protein